MSDRGAEHVPCPPLPCTAEVAADPAQEPDLRPLPAGPGVFALEDDAGRTIALAITANVRRLVRARLAPIDATDRASRRIDYRAVTRRVRAARVGSSFEAEWAYLQLARRRLPEAYRTLLDRWQGWFVRCTPDAPFPRFERTDEPVPAPGKTLLGPFPDRRAAQVAIEALEEIFDLCRYYQVLCEAPHGTACAYKEMGKCPAPCDGSVGMDEYRDSVHAALSFLQDPPAGRAAIETAMRRASDDLAFEEARRAHRRLEAAAPFADAKYRHVDRLERFRFVAVAGSGTPERARLFTITGGWIEPWADVPRDVPDAHMAELIGPLQRRLDAHAERGGAAGTENIGLVCRWLFHRPSGAAGTTLLRAPGPIDATALRAAIRAVGRGDGDVNDEDDVTETQIDAAP